MKRMLAVLLAMALLVTTMGVVAKEHKKEEKEDEQVHFTSTVNYAFTTRTGQEIRWDNHVGKVRVLCFVNLSADTSYFFADDLSNSQWATENTVEILAVDVTGAESDSLTLYDNGLDSAAIALATDANKQETAEAFAKEAGLDVKKLTLPFTVILDGEGVIRYAIEGYRKPDLLASYISALTQAQKTAKVQPALYGYGWKDSIRLFWLVDETAKGYTLWRASTIDGVYEQVYVTKKIQEAAFTDSHTVINNTYFYKLELTGADKTTSWSKPVQVLLEKE